MRDLLELICSVLGSTCTLDIAGAVRERAGELGVDVLAYLSHNADLSEQQVYERAAAHCDLAFVASLPSNLVGTTQINRVDQLGSARSINAWIFDREVLFVSPSATQMLMLGNRQKSADCRPRHMCIVPPAALRRELVTRSSDSLLDHSRQRLAGRWAYASAHLDLSMGVRIIFVASLLLLTFIAAFAPLTLAPVLVPVLTILFLPPAWFRLTALFHTDDRGNNGPGELLSDALLPTYTILIPLRDEASMVPQLARAMRDLNYPSEKLDIKFVVESTSASTLDAVRKTLDDPRFELIEVPQARPHTKPKALNYAMPMVRGTYVVVYDAEDIPEPDQLRHAATVFARDMEVDCLQAELVVDNAEENWLTALFAAEYSGLFGVMLPALGAWRLPMPLGGTSNHFRVQSLREVGGWDAFNVTEDADLGIRLSRLRYRVGTLASRTYEEAPMTLEAWMGQRSRWMKGWMQTFIVHNRYAGKFLADAGWRNFLAFQIYVGGMILTAPLHTIFVIALIVKLLITGHLQIGANDAWTFSYLFLLFAGYSGAIAHSVVGVLRLKRPELLGYQLLLPFYWMLTGVAAFRAAHELLVRPYFWSKTKHGLTRRRVIKPK